MSSVMAALHLIFQKSGSGLSSSQKSSANQGELILRKSWSLTSHSIRSFFLTAKSIGSYQCARLLAGIFQLHSTNVFGSYCSLRVWIRSSLTQVRRALVILGRQNIRK